MNSIRISLLAILLSALVSGTAAQDGHDHAGEVDSSNAVILPAENPNAHNDELAVELTSEAIALAGISLATIERGRIDQTVELPGEVGFNEDRVAHIAPRFAGIAQQANFRVGDYVNRGDIVATVESNESMNDYSILAPISGWVIERHITAGEFVSQENSIYVIVDLSTVWVNLAVYPKDADRIKKGQMATIRAIGSKTVATGPIEYVTPIMDLRTRSLTARIILTNPDNSWRPGSFVQAVIATGTGNEGLLVRKEAVQYLGEESVIFVVDGPNRFVPVPIAVGDSDHSHVQILSELPEATQYVSTGAFELKAQIVTSNLDAHAGHGH